MSRSSPGRRSSAGLLALILAGCSKAPEPPSEAQEPGSSQSAAAGGRGRAQAELSAPGTRPGAGEPAGDWTDDPALPVRSGPAARSVLLITLDTVRADHLSLYGYERPTSPQLEAFAQTATVYRKAKAAAPWTLPAHASLFTGVYPFEHGARTVRVEDVPKQDRFNNAVPLSRDFVTLAEVFQVNGWQTVAQTANVAYLSDRYQIDQGFDTYEFERGTVDKVNQRFFRWLRQREAESEPFFAFLNFMDAHRPYNITPREGFPDHGKGTTSGELMRELYPLVLMRRGAPAERVSQLVDLYDLALANLDAGLGQLFQRLKRLGLYDDMLIVIVGDHGEFLGEHDLLEHSKDVYEPTMNVPLLIKAPGQSEAHEDAELISQVHLPALILSYCDLEELPSEAARLGRHWPRSALLGENYFSRLHDLEEEWGERFQRVRSVVYQDRWKYIHSSDGQHELYDLGEDRAEARNLLDAEEAATWAARIEALMPERDRLQPGSVPQSLNAAEIEALRRLGYLDGQSDGDQKGGAPGPAKDD